MIYIVTNREIDTKNEPDLIFGASQNKKDIDEIRLATAEKKGAKWKVSLLEEPKDLKDDSDLARYPSFTLFKDLQKRMKENKRNCLFFIHGFNVNFIDALKAAEKLRKKYNVEIVLFTWPAKGAGEGKKMPGEGFLGLLNYRKDKRIASVSAPHLAKSLKRLGQYFEWNRQNGEDCGQSMNLLCHSMGAYVFKTIFKSSIYAPTEPTFDNVVLAAADVNNEGHELFVDKIPHLRKVYIAINEDDKALTASRMKIGEKQKARLGQLTRNFAAENAIYLDFTDAPKLNDSHSYVMECSTGEKKNIAHKVFNEILNGQRGERLLNHFYPGKKVCQVK